MSFDLKILNRDLVIGGNGDFQQVVDTEKLIQDILKLALTPLGANKFFKGYGSGITATLVGNAFDMQFISSVSSNQLRNSITMLQTLQREQSSRQLVTAAEQIASIKNLSVERNAVDPRFFEIFISVLTKALTVASAQFVVNTL